MGNSETLQLTTPTEREIVMTRVFDAPRTLVFDALTRPELLKRWYGPRGWALAVCDIDLRVGGAYRFVSRRPDGKDIGQRGASETYDRLAEMLASRSGTAQESA